MWAPTPPRRKGSDRGRVGQVGFDDVCAFGDGCVQVVVDDDLGGWVLEPGAVDDANLFSNARSALGDAIDVAAVGLHAGGAGVDHLIDGLARWQDGDAQQARLAGLVHASAALDVDIRERKGIFAGMHQSVPALEVTVDLQQPTIFPHVGELGQGGVGVLVLAIARLAITGRGAGAEHQLREELQEAGTDGAFADTTGAAEEDEQVPVGLLGAEVGRLAFFGEGHGTSNL